MPTSTNSIFFQSLAIKPIVFILPQLRCWAANDPPIGGGVGGWAVGSSIFFYWILLVLLHANVSLLESNLSISRAAAVTGKLLGGVTVLS